METLPMKRWTSTAPPIKKYLSRIITHKLSQKLNSMDYDVVFESPLKKDSPFEPDVVVFNKRTGFSSVMAIEICRTDEISDLLIIARDLMETYMLLDFFLYDQEKNSWYNIRKSKMGYEISSDPFFMGVALDTLQLE